MSVFSLIANIPKQYHAANLRDYFNSIIESPQIFLNSDLSEFSSQQPEFYCISCFHYRHRPFSKLPFKISKQTIFLPPSEKINFDNIGIDEQLNCCIVSFINEYAFRTFHSLYNGKHFLSTDSSTDFAQLPEVCLTFRLQVSISTSAESPITISLLHSLPEFRPPPGLPRGNVGTPIDRVLDSIRHCLLPASALRSLGPDFFKRRAGGRIYSRVPPPPSLAVTSTASFANSCDSASAAHSESAEEESLRTASGRPLLTASASEHEDRSARSEALSDGESVNDRGAVDSDDEYDAEEWERHEALHDDPSQYSYRYE